jgi:invasion protein IalB
MMDLKRMGMAVLVLGAASVLVLPAAAATRVQKTFGGWRVDCTEKDDGKTACALQYALVTQKDKRPVFNWTIIPGQKDKSNRVLLRTPTGVLLAEGVKVGIEGAEPVKINYLTCGPKACIAEFDLTDQWLKALGSYPKAIVAYTAVNRETIRHEIDLAKFGDAFKFYESEAAAGK